ncbi:MAG: asparagine synthase (glutamine-hydrolyzing) [Lachnospiraceae bacterium]|nr:asparagine synthase (glutamine-hydrolyzing) [Lachnospiraceae bacterium]
MCAICGFFSFSGPMYGEYEKVRESMRSMLHRGPDDQGAVSINVDNGIYGINLEQSDYPEKCDGIFGFNRLSIKDLSSEGHQPMVSDDNNVALIFNGEIYNDSEIRDELLKAGWVFRGHSDTEVLLKCYLEYGFDVTVRKLNGMFGFAIVDLRLNRLFISRDRFGIKPIYYCIQKGMISFASELKGLIPFSNVTREIDIDAYNSRIMFSRLSDRVLLKNVQMLDPGCFLCASFDGVINQGKYWDIDKYIRVNDRFNNIEEAIDELDVLLENAVRRQIVSDVPVGCQVSGGIDSTLICYYANKTGGQTIKDGISIVDSSKTGKNEEYYIDQVGERLELNIHKHWMDEDFFLKNFQYASWCNDAPLYQPYFVSFYLLAKEAKKYVTVLMSGEGSDETAGGYGRFSAGLFFPFIQKNIEVSSTIKKYDSFAEYEIMSDSTITGFCTKGYRGANDLIATEVDRFNRLSGSDFTKQLKYETLYRLPEACLRQDKMTMAATIENRVPLLDNEVVDFVMTLPESYLIRFADTSPCNLGPNPFRWVEGKYIYKELLKRKFGHEFVYRKKGIMVFDEKKILSGDGFKNLYFEIIYPSMRDRDMVDYIYINNLYERIDSLSKNEVNLFWRCIGLELWTMQFIDGKYIPTSIPQ